MEILILGIQKAAKTTADLLEIQNVALIILGGSVEDHLKEISPFAFAAIHGIQSFESFLLRKSR
jgi:hypothetical protein